MVSTIYSIEPAKNLNCFILVLLRWVITVYYVDCKGVSRGSLASSTAAHLPLWVHEWLWG